MINSVCIPDYLYLSWLHLFPFYTYLVAVTNADYSMKHAGMLLLEGIKQTKKKNKKKENKRVADPPHKLFVSGFSCFWFFSLEMSITTSCPKPAGCCGGHTSRVLRGDPGPGRGRAAADELRHLTLRLKELILIG